MGLFGQFWAVLKPGARTTAGSSAAGVQFFEQLVLVSGSSLIRFCVCQSSHGVNDTAQLSRAWF